MNINSLIANTIPSYKRASNQPFQFLRNPKLKAWVNKEGKKVQFTISQAKSLSNHWPFWLRTQTQAKSEPQYPQRPWWTLGDSWLALSHLWLLNCPSVSPVWCSGDFKQNCWESCGQTITSLTTTSLTMTFFTSYHNTFCHNISHHNIFYHDISISLTSSSLIPQNVFYLPALSDSFYLCDLIFYSVSHKC